MNSRRPLPGQRRRQAVPFILAVALAITVSFSPSGLAFTGKELLPIRQIATFGGKEGKARLRQPSAVAVGRGGKVFILDGTVNRVAVFSPDGRFLYDFGTEYLNMPLGMSLDSKDHVYVTDTRNGRIQVFSSKGEHLRQISLPKGKGGGGDETGGYRYRQQKKAGLRGGQSQPPCSDPRSEKKPDRQSRWQDGNG